MSAGQQTYLARNLRSGTDYLVSVIAQYPNSVGESVSSKARTSERNSSQLESMHTLTYMPMLELIIAQTLLQERV